MDLVQVLKALSAQRRWVAIGAGVAFFLALMGMFKVSLFPPGLSARSSAISAATTEVLVDSEQTFLDDLRREIEPLTQRAGAFAHFVESQAVVEALSEASDIPASEIAVHGPVANASEASDPTSEQRANALRQDSEPYRVQVTFDGDLPILSIYTQAPSVDAARRLANGMASALRTLVAGIQEPDRAYLTRANRVEIRQLGPAQAGVVSESAGYVLGILIFVGVFGVACVLILVARNLGDAWQEDEQKGGKPAAPPKRRPGPRAERPPMPFAKPTAVEVEPVPWGKDARRRRGGDR